MKEKHHKNGYLLKAIDEGQFFYLYMLMPSRYAPLVEAAAIQSPITMLWDAPLPALSKTGVFMAWYDDERLHWRSRNCPRIHHDEDYYGTKGTFVLIC